MNDDLTAPDEIIGVVPLSPAAREGLEGLFRVRTPDFRAMALAAGLDPAMDFRGKDLRGIDFRRSNMSGFDFSGTDLRGCNFSHARVDGAHFVGARRVDGDNRWVSLPHDGSVSDAVFSIDGSFVVTASVSGTALVWDIARGATPAARGA
jgi:WD40 repeat protein